MVHWKVCQECDNYHVISCDLYVMSYYRVILKEDISCDPLNYSGVAIVVIRLVRNFIPIPLGLIPIHPFLSVVILAFVKSSGKKTSKNGKLSETTPLLPEQDSLEGSLRDKVVSNDHHTHTHTHTLTLSLSLTC